MNPDGIDSRDLMKTLSDDAKVILGSYFGMMIPGKGQLVFHLLESRPTLRAQAALDELVDAGAIKREPFNEFGGIKYTPQINNREFSRWLGRNLKKGKWPATEPIPQK